MEKWESELQAIEFELGGAEGALEAAENWVCHLVAGRVWDAATGQDSDEAPDWGLIELSRAKAAMKVATRRLDAARAAFVAVGGVL